MDRVLYENGGVLVSRTAVKIFSLFQRNRCTRCTVPLLVQATADGICAYVRDRQAYVMLHVSANISKNVQHPYKSISSLPVGLPCQYYMI